MVLRGEIQPGLDITRLHTVARLRAPYKIEEGEVVGIWVGFRDGDHFPATPNIKVTLAQSDPDRPHLRQFTGVELAQFQNYMAWGEGVEVQGIANPDRLFVALSKIAGITVDQQIDPFFLEPYFG